MRVGRGKEKKLPWVNLVQLGGDKEKRKRIKEVRNGEKMLFVAGTIHPDLFCSFCLL